MKKHDQKRKRNLKPPLPDYSETPRNQTGKDSGSSRRNERNEGTPGTEDSIRKDTGNDRKDKTFS